VDSDRALLRDRRGADEAVRRLHDPVFAGERTWLTPVLRPVERGFYRLAGINEQEDQHWTAYAISMLLFNCAGFLLLYLLQRVQGILPVP